MPWWGRRGTAHIALSRQSTVGPGTTRERLLPIFVAVGPRRRVGLYLAFSPQRIDPGRQDHTLRTTPKIVAGLTAACDDRAEALYALVCNRVVRVSTPEAAEPAWPTSWRASFTR